MIRYEINPERNAIYQYGIELPVVYYRTGAWNYTEVSEKTNTPIPNAQAKTLIDEWFPSAVSQAMVLEWTPKPPPTVEEMIERLLDQCEIILDKTESVYRFKRIVACADGEMVVPYWVAYMGTTLHEVLAKAIE